MEKEQAKLLISNSSRFTSLTCHSSFLSKYRHDSQPPGCKLKLVLTSGISLRDQFRELLFPQHFSGWRWGRSGTDGNRHGHDAGRSGCRKGLISSPIIILIVVRIGGCCWRWRWGTWWTAIGASARVFDNVGFWKPTSLVLVASVHPTMARGMVALGRCFQLGSSRKGQLRFLGIAGKGIFGGHPHLVESPTVNQGDCDI